MVVFNESLYVKNPIVSVIVITYNQEKYIKDCLDSIVNQSVDFSVELIIADDASIDKTRKICLEYQKKYPECVKLVFNEVNLGLIKNYLNVLSYCKGKYIAQVAGDDYWCDINKLAIQKKFLDENVEIGLVYTDSYRLDNGKFYEKMVNRQIKSFNDHLLSPGYLAPNSWMYRLEYSPLNFLSEKNEHYVDESYAYLLDMFMVSKIAFIPQFMAVYRSHKGSLSYCNTFEKSYKFNKGLFNIKQEYLKKYNIVDEQLISEVYSNSYIQLIEDAIALNDINFMNEMKEYFKSHNLKFSDVEVLAKISVQHRHNYLMILNSKAYRLGKIMLRPFLWIKHYIS